MAALNALSAAKPAYGLTCAFMCSGMTTPNNSGEIATLRTRVSAARVVLKVDMYYLNNLDRFKRVREFKSEESSN
jgi:hypothetical protein